MRSLRTRETYEYPLKGDLKAHLGHLNRAPRSDVKAAVTGQPPVVSNVGIIHIAQPVLTYSEQSTFPFLLPCTSNFGHFNQINISVSPLIMASPNGTIVDTYFDRTPIKGGFQYRCILCNGRTMRDTTRHKNSENHKAMVAGEEASVAWNHENERHLGSFLQNAEENEDVPQFLGFEDDDNTAAEPEPAGFTEALMKLLTEPYSDFEGSESSGEDEDFADLAERDFETILWKRL
ncbi:uncharacterized protein MELLADRAFT_87627 [Melampsora larici-populina 98AG31]|uniref:Uncharacterized protein n=1 Tax=Melampsora larici-populina (strain 98AG31 / pathotype 3-4-7) TaxID=747676 RepID=F4RP42_MELLP|nr:uncharacterized protein MELLADRAFT_87627 [Melampsora larici-populina 98AG31]EGG05917.1 hypothetical protein MELLADRAFT_87627 [Melampsora larici-populina 98AG31]